MRRAKDLIKGLRSGAEFRCIGLADRDRSRALHPFDNGVVLGWNVVLI